MMSYGLAGSGGKSYEDFQFHIKKTIQRETTYETCLQCECAIEIYRLHQNVTVMLSVWVCLMIRILQWYSGVFFG